MGLNPPLDYFIVAGSKPITAMATPKSKSQYRAGMASTQQLEEIRKGQTSMQAEIVKIQFENKNTEARLLGLLAQSKLEMKGVEVEWTKEATKNKDELRKEITKTKEVLSIQINEVNDKLGIIIARGTILGTVTPIIVAWFAYLKQ